MESIILKLVDSSPVLAVMLVFWYIQRKDYIGLVAKTQEENLKRETNYQETIKENQSIIVKLTEKFNIVEDIKENIEEIKAKIFK